MILFANFLIAVSKIIEIVLMIYMWIVIIRAILSWVQIPSLYSVSVILYYLTEPVLKPVRKFIPPYKLGGIDISPMIIILLILFIDSFLVKSLSQYAQQLLSQSTLVF
ncbi:MAG: YggT family protein [Candidatus Aminicenantes bacterium]|nr:MAG: YggT family protein [Candidatus Aminicenantes bacterium]